MDVALQVSFWAVAFALFAFAPNIALGICAINGRWGIAFLTENKVRGHFRWIAKAAFGLAILAFIATALNGAISDAFLATLLFLTLAFRLQRASTA